MQLVVAPSAWKRGLSLDRYPNWGDIEHQASDLELTVSVADALELRAALPGLIKLLEDGQPRTAGEREHKREARAAVERLLEGLNQRLRPYGVPQPGKAGDGEPGGPRPAPIDSAPPTGYDPDDDVQRARTN